MILSRAIKMRYSYIGDLIGTQQTLLNCTHMWYCNRGKPQHNINLWLLILNHVDMQREKENKHPILTIVYGVRQCLFLKYSSNR